MTQVSRNVAQRLVDHCTARQWRELTIELEREIPADLLEIIPSIHSVDGDREVSFLWSGAIILFERGVGTRAGTIDDLAEVIQDVQEDRGRRG